MPLHIIDHPLAKDCLAKLRDKTTDHSEYGNLSKPLAMLIAVYATQNLPITKKNIETPMCATEGEFLTKPITLVPILRAGLSMLSPVQALFPHAKTGFIGLQRTDVEYEPEQYYLNIPQDPEATVLILDPMIATGGSACAAVKHVKNLGFNDIRILSFLAAPEGISMLESRYPEISIYSAALDEKLDANHYIVPGLGDFGDRLFGTPHQKG